jgi:hypothetical protein
MTQGLRVAASILGFLGLIGNLVGAIAAIAEFLG